MISKEKEVAFLRSSIHVLEKGLGTEKRIKIVKKMFEELKEYLSVDEQKWGKRILYNIQENNQYTGLYDREDFFNIIERRRSIREYTGEVLRNTFLNIVNAANYAPSSCNRQPMEYMLISSKDKIEKLAELKKQNFIKTAPNIILALCNINVYYKQPKERLAYFMFMDSGVSIQNLILAAYYHEIGTCIVNTSFKENYIIKQMFGIPKEGYRVTAIITAGQYKKEVLTPGRKELKKMIHFEKWGNAK